MAGGPGFHGSIVYFSISSDFFGGLARGWPLVGACHVDVFMSVPRPDFHVMTETTASTTATPGGSGRVLGVLRVLLVVGLLIAVTVGLYVHGADFYRLGLEARVDHSDYRVLSPSAPVGHGYGIVGTILILTNLTYLLRRRFAGMKLGTMRRWLDMHVITGLLGSVLVLFHSAFQLRSAIASLTAYSLLLVVISGLVGRYLYGLVPNAGEQALASELSTLNQLFRGMGDYVTQQLHALSPPARPAGSSLFAAVMLTSTWRAQAAERRLVIDNAEERAAKHVAPAPLSDDVSAALVRIRRLVAQPVRAAAISEILRAWRGVHRFTAILMVLSVTVHIAVAWFFGFRWVFSD